MEDSCHKLSFAAALRDKSTLAVTWELIPGRGAKTPAQAALLEQAAAAARHPRISGVTLTDNPGGKAALSPYALALEIQRYGIEPIIHFACRDKNRSALESDLYALGRAGLRNLLILTGDCPVGGFQEQARPVFDLDAVQALNLAARLPKRLESSAAYQEEANAEFFAGAVVSPFKATEAEVMAQYYKLGKKIAQGAKFIISQLGYDARKFDELRRYMNLCHPDIPLIGNIFVLSLPVARLMNKNRIPGCVVTDAQLSAMEAAPAYPKASQLLAAAKLYAVLKGLGYDGVNLGGHGLKFEDITYIIDTGESLAPQWRDLYREFDYPQPGGFYYFTSQEKSGLNTDIPALAQRPSSPQSSARLAFFHLIHQAFFQSGSPLFSLNRSLAAAIDRSVLRQPFTQAEYLMKTLTNQCQFCGDCVMHELEFICPMSQCPKQQRNGACGGSCEGWCEKYPLKRQCIYVRIYNSCRGTERIKVLRDQYFPPCNWSLHQTSSWLNYFTKRES